MAEFDEKKLKQMILSFGASDCGFADCTELGSVPFPRAVSVCIKLLDAVVDEIDTEPTFTYYAHYKAVNELINQITLKTAMFLEQQGFRAYPIPASQSVGPRDNYAALFPHKTAATLAESRSKSVYAAIAIFVCAPAPRVHYIIQSGHRICRDKKFMTRACVVTLCRTISDTSGTASCAASAWRSAREGNKQQRRTPNNEIYPHRLAHSVLQHGV
jgi:hypothetical protein